MKTYNSPAQARSLREIEATAASPVINIIPEINGTVQPVQATEEGEKERVASQNRSPRQKNAVEKEY